MPKYMIERQIPGAGKMSAGELQAVAKKSNEVLHQLPEVQWVETFVTDDKLYCVYIAPNENAVREHARRGGFPADTVTVVRHVLDPSAAEAA